MGRDAAAPGGEDGDAWPAHQVAALAAYVANYGDLEADRVRYWRFAASLIDERGMSLDRVNAWLRGARPAAPALSA